MDIKKHSELIRSNAAMLFLSLFIFLVGIAFIIISTKLKTLNVPSTNNWFDAYLASPLAEKQLLVAGLTCSALCFVMISFLIIVQIIRKFYLRSFHLTPKGIASTFDRVSEGTVAYSDIAEIQTFRIPGTQRVNQLFYRVRNTNSWIFIPAKLKNSNTLLENIIAKTYTPLLQAAEKQLIEDDQLVFQYLMPGNYSEFYRQVNKLSNYPLRSQKAEQLNHLLTASRKPILLTSTGITLAERTFKWKTLTVTIRYAKHDTFIKGMQRKHEYDFICTLAADEVETIQLIGSAIANQQILLALLKKYAFTYLEV